MLFRNEWVHLNKYLPSINLGIKWSRKFFSSFTKGYFLGFAKVFPVTGAVNMSTIAFGEHYWIWKVFISFFISIFFRFFLSILSLFALVSFCASQKLNFHLLTFPYLFRRIVGTFRQCYDIFVLLSRHIYGGFDNGNKRIKAYTR